MNSQNNDVQLSFEEAIAELEGIVLALESNELPLEKAMDLFKRGVKLSSYCSKMLENIQGEINLLTENENGSLVEIPFNTSMKENGQHEF